MEYFDIYEIVSKYYPIGVSETDPRYFDFSGYKELQKLSEHKEDSLIGESWRMFLTKVKERISSNWKHVILSSEYQPCFSVSFLISSEADSIVTYTRELEIHVSLLGQYYTIFGVDTVSLNQMNRRLDPLIFVSPEEFYKQSFVNVRELFQEFFSNYRLVPFYLLKYRVPGLCISGAINRYDKDGSLFQALFTYEPVTEYLFEGDEFYE